MYRSGRRFIQRLPEGRDILTCIGEICAGYPVQMGVFSLIGTVRSATVGILDPKQRVYITRKEEGPFEILSCVGNISLQEESPVTHAKIVLADEKNRVLGGHLLSETLLFYGELDLEEIEGAPLVRHYDEPSGLFLWPPDRSGKPYPSP